MVLCNRRRPPHPIDHQRRVKMQLYRLHSHSHYLSLSSHFKRYENELETMATKHTTEHTEKKVDSVEDSKLWYRWDSVMDEQILFIFGVIKDYKLRLFVGAHSWATCTCKGFYFNGRCTHILKTTKQIKRGLIAVKPQLSTKEN